MDEQTLDLEALSGLTDPDQVRTVAAFLESLEKDTELLLFVSPGCVKCPHQVRSTATVALASEHVTLEIVDTSQEPELAARYEVRSVPTTVVDDELIMAGVVGPAELALRLVERQGPKEAQRVFTWLVANGHHAAAAERLADGRGTGVFVDLWSGAGEEERKRLLAMVDEALLYNPFGLNELVPHLVAGLDEATDDAEGDARREDTAHLLGKIGHADARPTLERLAAHQDRFVARAAKAALTELDEAEV